MSFKRVEDGSSIGLFFYGVFDSVNFPIIFHCDEETMDLCSFLFIVFVNFVFCVGVPVRMTDAEFCFREEDVDVFERNCVDY